MSDLFDDPLDVLNAIDEQESQPSSNPRQSAARKRPKKRGPTFDDPLDKVPAQAIGRATQSQSMAGRYKRKTFLILPQQLEYLYQIAEQEGMGIMETHRWLLDTAFQVYDDGFRPSVEAKTVRVRAKMSHWSGTE